MSEANTSDGGLPTQSVVMRLTEGAVPPNPACYADALPFRKEYMTQQEIADAIGVSRAMIHHIEKRAIAKIRMEFDSRGWTFEDSI